MREGLPAALEGADALAAAKAAKAYANAIEDAQEAASRAARPAARRAGSGRLAGGTRSLAARRAPQEPFAPQGLELPLSMPACAGWLACAALPPGTVHRYYQQIMHESHCLYLVGCLTAETVRTYIFYLQVCEKHSVSL